MKVSTVADVNELPDDSLVHAFRGTIKQLFKRKTGESDRGPWSFENMVVSDGRAEIKVILKDRDPLDPILKGKVVYLLSSQTSKGWHGVKAKDDEYDGKVKRILWVTGAAEIVPGTEYEARGAQATAQAPASAKDAPAHPEPQKPQEGHVTPDKHLFNARQFAGRRVSLLKVATRAALQFKREFDSLPDEMRQGIKLEGDVFWARVTSIFISLEAEGLAMRRGFADGLPTNISLTDLKPVKNQPASTSQAPAAPAPPPQPPPPTPEDSDDETIPF
ncbi:MAG: hypothetical protein KGJ13_09610 [Patescibacteria group bacterium]|nr:hypothetical protein [Patescibacteria group bacterium]